MRIKDVMRWLSYSRPSRDIIQIHYGEMTATWKRGHENPGMYMDVTNGEPYHTVIGSVTIARMGDEGYTYPPFTVRSAKRTFAHWLRE